MRCNIHDYDIMEDSIAIGEKRAKLEATRNMLLTNLGTIEQIAAVQGLSLETIKQLADELKVSAVQ